MLEYMESEQISNDDNSTQWSSDSKIDFASIPVLELPTDFLRSSAGTDQYAVVSHKIPVQTRSITDQFISTNNVDLKTVLIATYANLLYRYSSQELFYLGDLSSKSLKLLIVDFIDNPPFWKVLSMVGKQLKEPPKINQNTRLLSPVRAFYSFDSSENDPELKKLDLFHADICFSFSAIKTKQYIKLTFNTAVFKKETIEQMAGHFVNLLNDSVLFSGKEISRLELLTPEEKKRLLFEWNSTVHPVAETISLCGLLEQQIKRQPDSVALIENDFTLTYGELDHRSNQLANYLKKAGIGIETPVGVCMERSIELITSIIGIIKAGGTYVPIDPLYPSDHIKSIISDCAPEVILTNTSHLDILELNHSKIVVIDANWSAIDKESPHCESADLTQDNRFYIMYTSGSVGKPKGVEGLYKGIINRLYWMWDTYPYCESDICCHKTSIGFVDHIAEILCPLLKGIPLVILPDNQSRNAEQIVNVLIKHNVTRVLLVPSLLHSILKLSTEKLMQLVELRYVFTSAEALPVTLVKRFYQNFRTVRLVNIYGSTEVSADVTFYEIKRFFVGDVLKYFTQSIDIPGDLKSSFFENDYPLQHNRVTTADVTLEEVAAKFKSSEIQEYPLTLEQYFRKISSDVLPNVINTAAPTFIGHMTSALPDFVHDLSKLISQLNQNLVKIETAKSLIFLEREALAILHRSFYSQSSNFYNKYIQKLNANLGLVTTGGTTANITALLTARNKALFSTIQNFAYSGKSIYSLLKEKGYEDMTILGTHRMHYSIRKAISVLGLGIDTIMYVAADENGRLDTADLMEKIELCKKRKILIIAIVGIAGATETGQIDPLEDIGAIAFANKIHFHVDAAWGGTTIFSEKYKYKLKGIECADSITFCGHKQLYLPQGISICLFKDPLQLQFATTTASYQATIDSYDVGKFSLEGSRSAISLCLHAALRLIGKKGYEALVNYSMDLTSFFTKTIQSTNAFELIGTPVLNIVNYRYIPLRFRDKLHLKTLSIQDNNEINSFNRLLQEKQFLKGNTFVSKTTLTHSQYGEEGILVFRAVLSNPLTTQADLCEVLKDQLFIAYEINSDEGKSVLENPFSINDAVTDHPDTQFTNENNEVFIPIGRPVYNTKTYILDKHLNPLPPLVPGDLYIGGAALARGYFNNPVLTKASFIVSPFNTDERLFKTGDRARYTPEGTIEFYGRYDDLVKINGYRVELAEIEYHISLVENVLQNKVLLRDYHGNKLLVAYLVLKQKTSLEKIQEILSRKLPRYMQPAVYKEISKIPLLPNGKIDKATLAAYDI